MAVGINSLGVEFFFTRLFKKMGIEVTDNVAYYLKLREKNRSKRLRKIKTNEFKVKKNKRKHDLLVKRVKVAKIERLKREGTYQKGMNLDDPDDNGGGGKPPAKRMKVFCEYCGGSDHVLKRSAKCTQPNAVNKLYRKKNGSLLSGPPAAAPNSSEDDEDDVGAIIASNDCEQMDLTPWDAAYQSDSDERNPFELLSEEAGIGGDAGDVVIVGGAL
jgi:hypothetical protein